jgi:hypothetical protein
MDRGAGAAIGLYGTSRSVRTPRFCCYWPRWAAAISISVSPRCPRITSFLGRRSRFRHALRNPGGGRLARHDHRRQCRGCCNPWVALTLFLIRKELWVRGRLATAGVTVVCHILAQPVAGVGIALPVFVPPASAAIVALLLSRRYAAPLAYICGSMGTLIGADLLNLDKVQRTGCAGCIDRRCRDVRRHLSNRHSGGPARQHIQPAGSS